LGGILTNGKIYAFDAKGISDGNGQDCQILSGRSCTPLWSYEWETGSWADIAGLLGGPLLRIGLVLGGMMSAFGMFNALVMSYSRLPYAMAQDGMLPKVFARVNQRKAPWVSIVILATGWAWPRHRPSAAIRRLPGPATTASPPSGGSKQP
jgi:amino acid transporter